MRVNLHPYRRPRALDRTTAFGREAHRALEAVTACETSDPFAVARLRTHLLVGIEVEPDKVASSAEARVIARRADVLETYRRQMRALGYEPTE